MRGTGGRTAPPVHPLLRGAAERSTRSHLFFSRRVVSRTIRSRQDAVDFLTWTYFYRRLTRNPAYYHLEESSVEAVAEFLSGMVEATLADLENAGCVEVEESTTGTADVVRPTTLGHIASYYYLKYTTVALFCAEVHEVDDAPTELPTLLRILCDASEFDELPVRHNEEHVHAEMARELPWCVGEGRGAVRRSLRACWLFSGWLLRLLAAASC